MGIGGMHHQHFPDRQQQQPPQSLMQCFDKDGNIDAFRYIQFSRKRRQDFMQRAGFIASMSSSLAAQQQQQQQAQQQQQQQVQQHRVGYDGFISTATSNYGVVDTGLPTPNQNLPSLYGASASTMTTPNLSNSAIRPSSTSAAMPTADELTMRRLMESEQQRAGASAGTATASAFPSPPSSSLATLTQNDIRQMDDETLEAFIRMSRRCSDPTHSQKFATMSRMKTLGRIPEVKFPVSGVSGSSKMSPNLKTAVAAPPPPPPLARRGSNCSNSLLRQEEVEAAEALLFASAAPGPATGGTTTSSVVPPPPPPEQRDDKERQQQSHRGKRRSSSSSSSSPPRRINSTKKKRKMQSSSEVMDRRSKKIKENGGEGDIVMMNPARTGVGSPLRSVPAKKRASRFKLPTTSSAF
mmetsp:Transcript_22805/g.54027  ORF Transcript_22805/g.54027 Transcript_22805/m.54027 type:complete len:410 (+) Transcript_22805:100-1329(+)|eukprot:CAMPEP_0113467354 /NCGR_PEP_ID=MMETSP0014_2-20120614/14770_1 /TAXON_ID=2857 /ORGANISM="Nitzschia sp." /LENGTH=409 /DNA_ID=CAMNT_0000359657 /DNA_START=1 /DNA_END=1230 /DNA_ORIENTATION=- /assembly_acc=CAM_ASM_000159